MDGDIVLQTGGVSDGDIVLYAAPAVELTRKVYLIT